VEEPEFPPEVNNRLEGLLWLGYLEEEVTLAGHRITLRTLKLAEELEAARLSKDYIETVGAAKAHAASYVAAALQSVDGDFAFAPPIGPGLEASVKSKYNYITENWYWPAISYLYNQYENLLQKQAEAINALEDLSSRSLSTF